MGDVWIRGAAMTRFGKHADRSGRDLVEEAVAGAFRDAEVEARDVQAAYVGNALAGLMTGQESIRAQVVLRRTGLMGIPIVNVDNACAASSTALHLGWHAVASGLHDCVVVVGYEKLDHRDRTRSYRAINATADLGEFAEIFGAGAGDERSLFMDLAGAYSGGHGGDRFDRASLALVAVKNHRHGSLNPWSQYQEEVTAEQVLQARQVAGPLTRLMCAPLTDGAACLVLCSSEFRRSRSGGVRIAASVLTSGRGDDMRRPMCVVTAVRQAYETAGLGPEDLDVVELHDTTASAELYLYSALGLCRLEDSDRLLKEGATWLGGAIPVNTSGGLIARGHPIGATGAAQVVELAWQLEDRCGTRQVPAAQVALAESNGGWVGTDAGACCIHVLQR